MRHRAKWPSNRRISRGKMRLTEGPGRLLDDFLRCADGNVRCASNNGGHLVLRVRGILLAGEAGRVALQRLQLSRAAQRSIEYLLSLLLILPFPQLLLQSNHPFTLAFSSPSELRADPTTISWKPCKRSIELRVERYASLLLAITRARSYRDGTSGVISPLGSILIDPPDKFRCLTSFAVRRGSV